MKQTVGILLFKDVEVLDFCGPFEVFSVASELCDHTLFDVLTVAKTSDPVIGVNGLSVNPKYTFANCLAIDILIIPGGTGTKDIMEDEEIINWIVKVNTTSVYTASICSGARLLGKAGLLDNKPYVTHHQVYNHLAEIVPTGVAVKDQRYVQSGKIFTSGGISAGIDLSFYMVKILSSKQVATDTAAYMEYNLTKTVYHDEI